MKKLLLIILLISTFSEGWSQFRKRDRSNSPSSTNELNYASPSEYLIAGIEVEGLNVLDKNAIISLTGLRVGDKVKIPGDAISGAIRKLWNHGLVGDVAIEVDKIEGEQVYLILRLAERPRLTNYYFHGISKGQESSLKEDLDLIKGRIVTDAMVRNAETAVKKHFVKKGFLNTEVKVIQERDTLNREGIRLKIDVNVKSKVKINSIILDGNESIADSKLKKKMKKTKERPGFFLHRTILSELLSFNRKEYFGSRQKMDWDDVKEFLSKNVRLNVFSSSKFIKTEFEEDKKAIIALYNSKGYRDAEIVSDTVYNYNDKTINLEMKISEGPKYYFRNIIWTGNYIHTDKTLNAILGIQKGDIYNKEMIDRKMSFNPKGPDISGLYMDDGYLFFRINPVEVAVAGDSIDVEMRIFEGDQATINEVTITGNERTSDHVIRRELRTVPGQKFRRSDIIRTQQSLSQLGYFNPEKVGQNIMPNPANGTVDIEWQVEEQSNDQIELSGGWGGYYGFVGTLGLTFNNFSVRNIPHFDKWRPLPVGDGQRLSLRVQANGKAYQNYGFSFTEPWLGGRKPQSFTISYNHSVQRQSYYYTVDLNNAPRLKVHNFSVGLGRLLEWPDNYFTLSNSLSFTNYDLHNYPIFYGFSNGSSNTIALNTTLSRRSTGDPRYPTEGSEISLSLTLTPPFSAWRDIDYNDVDYDSLPSVEAFNQNKYKWIEYYKWMFDAKYYLSLDSKKKFVLEAKAHFGFIGYYSEQYGVGPFERFFLGGAGLAGGIGSFVLGQDIIGLRGYQDNMVTPPYYSGNTGNTGSTLINGGIVYEKLGLELRYPVTTGSAATIYGLVFLEGGNNWYNHEDFNPFDIYKSAGAGVRLFMPAFGLIGLNWAYGFDRLPNQRDISGSQFHFTIGQQIR